MNTFRNSLEKNIDTKSITQSRIALGLGEVVPFIAMMFTPLPRPCLFWFMLSLLIYGVKRSYAFAYLVDESRDVFNGKPLQIPTLDDVVEVAVPMIEMVKDENNLWQQNEQKRLAKVQAEKKKKQQQAEFTRSEREAIKRHSESVGLMELMKSCLHVLFVGGTGAGKTVMFHEFGRELSEMGAIIEVIDLKSDSIPGQRGGKWPFAQSVTGYGYGANENAYDDCTQKLKDMVALLEYRAEQQRKGVYQFTPLWLLVDEANILAQGPTNCKEAWVKCLELILRTGRELNMHIGICAQDMQVKHLGLEKKSMLLVNISMTFIFRKVRNKRTCEVLASGKPFVYINVPHVPKERDPFEIIRVYHQKAKRQVPPVVSDENHQKPVVSDENHQKPVVSDGNYQKPVVSDENYQKPVVSDGTPKEIINYLARITRMLEVDPDRSGNSIANEIDENIPTIKYMVTAIKKERKNRLTKNLNGSLQLRL